MAKMTEKGPRKARTKRSGNGSGSSGLAGYDYQIDISVWLALDLMLETRLTSQLRLEPASEEDIEADLEESEPARVVNHIELAGGTLVVQVKLRNGDAWTPATLKTLLDYGSEGRISATKRLQSQSIGYLLVTNAGLSYAARPLMVRKPGTWPEADAIPADLAASLPAGTSGRVAVAANIDDERLYHFVKRSLTESFRVPNSKWEDCWDKLREEARVRVKQGGGGIWRREEVEAVIRGFDGYFASHAEIESYVFPNNWSELRDKIAERSAVLIIGQSGTGKTVASQKLIEQLRDEIAGLTPVRISEGPQQLLNDQTVLPVVYDVEDPWGNVHFDPESRPWNDKILQVLSQARPNRMVIATSRLDVLQSADIHKNLAPWIVRLEAENYGQRERAALYHSRIPALPHGLQLLANDHSGHVLSKLMTPLEIQKFFDALTTLPEADLKTNAHGFVAQAIAQAHENSIELTVKNQIEARNDVRAAAIVWGLIKIGEKLSTKVLRNLEDALAERDPALTDCVQPFISFFVAARNLKQSEEVISYYHPRVGAGIEQVLLSHASVTRRTLANLAAVLMDIPGSDGDWGASATARLMWEAASHEDLAFKVSPADQRSIDDYLTRTVPLAGTKINRQMRLASRVGSEQNATAELARFLLNRPYNSFAKFREWAAPDRDEVWYNRIRSDPATKPFLEAFIRLALNEESDEYGRDLVHHLKRLADGLVDAYIDAACQSVAGGPSSPYATIATGALEDIDGFERVVDAAVAAEFISDEQRQKDAQIRLDIDNDVYGEAYEEHAWNYEANYAAGQYLQGYVEEVRRRGLWRRIYEHRHKEALRSYWVGDLQKTAKKGIDKIELASAFELCRGSRHESDMWEVLEAAWTPEYAALLLERLTAPLPFDNAQANPLNCAATHTSNELAILVQRLAMESPSNATSIAIDLGTLHSRNRRYDNADAFIATETAIQKLPVNYREIATASDAMDNAGTATLSGSTLDLLRGLPSPDYITRRFRLALDSTHGLLEPADVNWMLAHAKESNSAVLAAQVASRNHMAEALTLALSNKFAHAQAEALKTIGGSLNAPIPSYLLEMSEIPGWPVRSTLIAILDARPHLDHLPTLIELTRDTYSNHPHYVDYNSDYPIALAAAKAISKLSGLPEPSLDQLRLIGAACTDPDVRGEIFRIIVRSKNAAQQKELLKLAGTPGNRKLRLAAARALFWDAEAVDDQVIRLIKPEWVLKQWEPVCANLILLIGETGTIEAVQAMATALAVNLDRKVMLVLLINMVAPRDMELAAKLAALLPANHSGSVWAMDKTQDAPTTEALADLGNAAAVKATHEWIAVVDKVDNDP